MEMGTSGNGNRTLRIPTVMGMGQKVGNGMGDGNLIDGNWMEWKC